MKKTIQAVGITAGIVGVGVLVSMIPAEVGAVIVAAFLFAVVAAMIRLYL